MHCNGLSTDLTGSDETDGNSVAGVGFRETLVEVANSLFRNDGDNQTNNGESGDDDDSDNEEGVDATENDNNIVNDSMISELSELLENLDAAASDPNEEAIEQAMIRSAVHVWSARIQRKWYQEAAKRAQEDVEANKPHSQT
jgi:hypothetical protein